MNTLPWLAALAGAALVVLCVAWRMGAMPEARTLSPLPPPAAQQPGAAGSAASAGVDGSSQAAVPASVARPIHHSVDPAERNTVFRRHPDGRLVIDSAVSERLAKLVQGLPAGHSLTALEQAEHAVTLGLPAAQAAQALQLFRHYQAYQPAESQLLAQPRETESVASALQRLEQLVRLRAQHFGAENAAAMFGSEEALHRQRIGALGG